MSATNIGAANPASGTEQPKVKSTAETLAELQAACPGATADFVLDQASKGATVEQAKTAFIGFQAAQVRSRDEQVAALQTENATLKAAAAAKPADKPADKPAEQQAAQPPARPGVPPAASKPAEGTANAADENAGDPKAQAKAEWDANANNCRDHFVSEKAYVGFRSKEIAGKLNIKTGKK